jgi:UDP-glucose 4-epimerase
MAIYKFVQAALREDEIIVFGDGMQTRDFTYIDDVVEANLLVVANKAVGEVFNIGGGSQISINDLVKMIEDIVGRRLKIKYEEKQEGDVRNTWADISKAKQGLGWEPKVDISRGLRRFVEWSKAIG